jgi:hypothetical protein
VVEIWTIDRIADELGEDVATRAARLAVRSGPGGPYLTGEEVQHLLADLMVENRDH